MAELKYLAADFGAESGRVMLGSLREDGVALEEIHRFPNQLVPFNGRLRWNLISLFAELKKGLAKAAGSSHSIGGIGVDTWGVDFGLIDRHGQLIQMPCGYRDPRTSGMMEKVFAKIPRKRIYEITGTQFLEINTLFQLASLVEGEDPSLEIAHRILFMPDLFHYLLSGEVTSEYTIASTSQLLQARTRTWSRSLITDLGLPEALFPAITPPGKLIGKLRAPLAEELGLSRIPVIAPAAHDTASAVVAVPAEGSDWAYLSSGTWSLLGIETSEPIIHDESLNHNFTNEGGFEGKFRVLKNNMGMWLLERCRSSWRQGGQDYTYAELIEQARRAEPFRSIIDPDDPAFLNPADMPAALVDFTRETGQSPPTSVGEFARSIFESLALKYRFIVDEINELRPDPIRILHIVGGGSQNPLLNQFTSNATGLPVITGPVEATALGNVLVQAIATGEITDQEEARSIVRSSVQLHRYEPEDRERWEDEYGKARSALFSRSKQES